ncbi:putative RNA-binding nova protein, partial [Gregarina niphandrodes]
PQAMTGGDAAMPFTNSAAGPMAIVLIAGVSTAVARAIDYIIDILTQSFNMYGSIELRMVVPNSSVPPIMGKGGSKIMSIREGTGAKVQISGRDNSGIRQDFERIVLVSGQTEQVRNATKIVTSLIQADPMLKEYMIFSLSVDTEKLSDYLAGTGGSGRGTAAMPPVPPPDYHHSMPYHSQHHSSVAELTLQDLQPVDEKDVNTWIKADLIKPQVMQLETSVLIQIPDEQVGSLMGRSGQVLTEIRSSSGARITISQRGELVPGTRDRLVTIKGNMAAIHTAHALIVQRLAETQDEERQ